MPKTEVMHTVNRHVLILVALTALAAVPTARAQDALAKQARAILKAHCFVCHGEDGAAEGGPNFILDENPYGVTYDKQGIGIHTPVAAYCYKATGTDQPFIRADWFVAKASVPPLYHDILELPKTDRELEKRLRVDVARNLRIGRAARAGFTNSGVSQNNRLIERHNADLTRGAYWKSYDFAANSGRKNLFAHPLGPSGAGSFQHDGGEILFNLPNGLQAYLLVDAKGNRIDKGPNRDRPRSKASRQRRGERSELHVLPHREDELQGR